MSDLETEIHDNALRPAEHGIGNAKIVERSTRDVILARDSGKAEAQTAKKNFGLVFGQFKPGGTV